MKVRVALVDDDAAVRQGLRLLLNSIGIQSSEFDSADQFLNSSMLTSADCVLLDVRMPGVSGLEVLAELQRRKIRAPVILLTGHADVPMAVRAMKQGAFDFMEKPFNAQLLLDRVQAALQFSEQQRQEQQVRERMQASFETLSRREREVLQAIVDGRTNKLIAQDLGISERTVEMHRANLMQKTGMHSVAELVQVALAAGSDTCGQTSKN